MPPKDLNDPVKHCYGEGYDSDWQKGCRLEAEELFLDYFSTTLKSVRQDQMSLSWQSRVQATLLMAGGNYLDVYYKLLHIYKPGTWNKYGALKV
jgi:hypothetical protein